MKHQYLPRLRELSDSEVVAFAIPYAFCLEEEASHRVQAALVGGVNWIAGETLPRLVGSDGDFVPASIAWLKEQLRSSKIEARYVPALEEPRRPSAE